MKKYNNIKQGSVEWYDIRWGKIGGTLSGGLFIRSDTLLIDILSQRNEEVDYGNGFANYAMERGNEFEPLARDFLIKETGKKFKECGWLESEENELLGISPDGITDDDEHSCEIKCFGRKKHFDIILKNEIPLENIHQNLHYFTVNPKLKTHTFISFRLEAPKHFIKVLTLDSEINLGTKAKPIIKTIRDARNESIKLADELLKEIKIKENELLTIIN
jgi:hypothetical protein